MCALKSSLFFFPSRVHTSVFVVCTTAGHVRKSRVCTPPHDRGRVSSSRLFGIVLAAFHGSAAGALRCPCRGGKVKILAPGKVDPEFLFALHSRPEGAKKPLEPAAVPFPSRTAMFDWRRQIFAPVTVTVRGTSISSHVKFDKCERTRASSRSCARFTRKEPFCACIVAPRFTRHCSPRFSGQARKVQLPFPFVQAVLPARPDSARS